MKRRDFLLTSVGLAGMTLLGCKAAQPPAEVSKLLNAKEFHVSRRFVETGFGRIAYVELGEGPSALFLHGFPLNGFQWRGSLERLSSHRRCIAPDFMGLGYTESPEQQDLSPQAQTDLLAAFLDKLSIPALTSLPTTAAGQSRNSSRCSIRHGFARCS